MFRKKHFLFLAVISLLLISACLPVSSSPVAQQPAEDTLPLTATASLSDVTTLPTIAPTTAPTTAMTLTSRPGWSTYTVPNVIAFDYPND